MTRNPRECRARESRRMGSRERLFPSLVWKGSREGDVPLHRNFVIFFVWQWWILGTCFNVSIRRVKQSQKAVLCANCQIGQLSHMVDVSSMIPYT